MSTPVTAPVEIPATIPIASAELSFADQRAFTREGKEDIPNPAAPAVEVKTELAVTPEVEADSAKPDAELSEAGRVLRKNRGDERLKKIREQNDELARELHRRQTLRSELERAAPAQPPATVGAAPSPTGSTDPRDPEPSLESYTAHPDTFPDPWSAFDRDHKFWVAREVNRQVAQGQRQTQHATELATRLDAREAAARAAFSDFDAVVAPLYTALNQNPRLDDVRQFVADLDPAIGGELLYRLGKSPNLAQAVLTARTPRDVTRALTRLEVSLTAPKPAPQPSHAPAPHQPVGGGATVTDDDENTMGTNAFLRKRRAERAAAVRGGQR